MALPANQLPIGEGLLPDETRAPFYLDATELKVVRDEGPVWKYEDARFIEEAVIDPDAIFIGLRRPNHNQAYCYSVRPSRDPDIEYGLQEILPPVLGRVFLVFVVSAAMGYLVFDWEWRVEADDDPGHPENWKTDFLRRAWKRH